MKRTPAFRSVILVSVSLLVLIPGIASAQWLPDGNPVCTAAGNQRVLKMIPDGSGGTIIVWEDHRNGTNYNIYAQRMDNSGNELWTADGVRSLCGGTSPPAPVRLRACPVREGKVLPWHPHSGQ